MGTTLLILLLVFLFLNLPVYVALLLSSVVSLLWFTDLSIGIAVQRMFSGIDKFTLMAIPFFIFAANIMNRGGLAPKIVRFAETVVGHIPGGLAFAVCLSCMFLGATSGSSPATLVAICSLMMAMMLGGGYSQGFTIGLIMAASSVAVIIPPSIGMIIYGAVTGTSVGELYSAGFIPGVVYGGVFMVYSYFYAKKYRIPVRKRATPGEICTAFKKAGWALGFPLVVLGSIYGGLCTPTEAAGIGCVYSLIVGVFIYKEMSLRDLANEAYKSAVGTAQVMIILAASSAFAWMMTRFQIPMKLAEAIMSYGSSQLIVLMLMNIIMLIAGMLTDPASFQMILSPLFLPLARAVGVDPVHLGIIMVVNGAIGMFTPPFGLNLFMATSVTKIPLGELIKPRIVGPWVAVSLVALALITYIPWLTMVVPKLLFR
jgi:C4-dicarboxylate transporter DctM subunit